MKLSHACENQISRKTQKGGLTPHTWCIDVDQIDPFRLATLKIQKNGSISYFAFIVLFVFRLTVSASAHVVAHTTTCGMTVMDSRFHWQLYVLGL